MRTRPGLWLGWALLVWLPVLPAVVMGQDAAPPDGSAPDGAAPDGAAPGATAGDPIPPDGVESPRWPRSSRVFDAPDPFSLNGYDALQVMALLRREGLVVQTTPDGRRIVAVEHVEAVPAASIPSYPPAHRRRWNILLNGEPLPWDITYIEYGGTLTNLRLLFTYRNMRPIPDIPYVLGP